MTPKTNIIRMPEPKPEKQEKKRRRERGSGGLVKRGRTWWIRYNANGKRVQESTKRDVKQVAVELLQRRLTEAQDGAVPDRQLAFESMHEALVRDYTIKGHKSLLTRADGSRYIGAAPALQGFFRGYRAKDITTAVIKRFIQERQAAGVTNGGINGSLALLRRMFWLQVEENHYPMNLVPHFPMLPKSKPRQDHLTPAQYVW